MLQQHGVVTGLKSLETLVNYRVREHGRCGRAVTGDRDEDGERIPMDVQVGDKVLYAKYSGTEVKMDGKKLLILRESDILAVIEG